MQTSGSGHASRALELGAILPVSRPGSIGLNAADTTGGAAAEAPLPIAFSALPIEPVASLASFSTGSDIFREARSAVARIGVGRGSDKVAVLLPVSATQAPPRST